MSIAVVLPTAAARSVECSRSRSCLRNVGSQFDERQSAAAAGTGAAGSIDVSAWRSRMGGRRLWHEIL